MKNRCLSIFAFLYLVTLLYVPTSTAQSVVSGEIGGTVTDASGAVIPSAPVNLTSSETGFNENTTTSTNGTFRFALVKPGTYTLTVTVKGFSTVKRNASSLPPAK